MQRLVFLDRDGTINIDHGYVYRIEDWNFTDRAIDALRMLKSAGYGLAIVTNQAGIARGYYSLADVDRLHQFLGDALRSAGVQLDAVALCPHMPEDGCDCRKPRVGMARQIEKQLGPIDYSNSWTIGDKVSDIQFGIRIGTKTGLIRSPYWNANDLTTHPDLIVDTLYEAACQLAK